AEYKKYSKDKIEEAVHSMTELREIWLDPEKREQLVKELENKKVNINLIKLIENLEDVDSFDIISHLVFDAPLLTREDRVKHFMRSNSEEINKYGKEIKEAVFEVMDKYKNSGEENLSAQFFTLPNMFERKEAIQKEYPSGLRGFIG
ncbi:MAG: restriction endonuclease, partial [Candidatus Taylorbacteria bacterium]|nr:restriction endonuclease [Candidatus Taylorbacteria bacterium]